MRSLRAGALFTPKARSGRKWGAKKRRPDGVGAPRTTAAHSAVFHEVCCEGVAVVLALAPTVQGTVARSGEVLLLTLDAREAEWAR